MKAVCINNICYNLTVGKVYDIQTEPEWQHDKFCDVIDDIGNTVTCFRCRFEDLKNKYKVELL